MIGLIDSDHMTKCDNNTINHGVLATTLMQKAAESVRVEILDSKNICIVAGKGNNGGDGIALAYLLQNDLSKNIDLVLLSDEVSTSSQYFLNKINWDIINRKNLNELSSEYDVVIDCIFGNGLTRSVKGIYLEAIEKINSISGYKVSIDIPSGLSSSTGQVFNNAVKANKTIAIQERKLGHYLQDAKDFTGEIIVKDIGIDIDYYDAYLIEDKDLRNVFPKRKNNTSKIDYGRVVIIGGSKNYVGAPMLAQLGVSALRSGAGLTTIATTKTLASEIRSRVVDTTVMPLKEKNGCIDFDEEEIKKICSISNTIVFGPGVGITDGVKKVLLYILSNFTGTIVIDADAIKLFSTLNCDFKNFKCNIILTPHYREASTLLNVEVSEIEKNPIYLIKEYARINRIIVLLKGPTTVITDGEKVFLSSEGTPAQAKAGNGDVLSGVIGAISSFHKNVIEAVYASTYIVGKAAKKKAAEMGEYSVLASDIPSAIKSIFNKFHK